MRLIIKFNEQGAVQTWYRELDWAELPAQNGIVQTLGTLYHCVNICSVSPIFAQFRPVRRHWKRSVEEDTKQYIVSEPKKRCGPGAH